MIAALHGPNDRWRGPNRGCRFGDRRFVLISDGVNGVDVASSSDGAVAGVAAAGSERSLRSGRNDSQIREFEPFPALRGDLRAASRMGVVCRNAVTMDELIDQVQIRRAVNREDRRA